MIWILKSGVIASVITDGESITGVFSFTKFCTNSRSPNAQYSRVCDGT